MDNMAAYLLDNQNAWRMGIFLGGFVLLALLQSWHPRRAIDRLADRWRVNLTFGIINMILVRLALPTGLIGLAAVSQTDGLIGQLGLPTILGFILSLLLLDLLLYVQHRAFHRLSWLWPLHAPHHCDRALDVSSGLRFHPGEALVSAGVKALGVVALGATPLAVLVFEILLNAASLFTHANWSLGRVDSGLQKIIVTPDMHRLHHLRAPHDKHGNFGFFLSLWDHIFGTWQTQPQAAHETMALGLDDLPNDKLRASILAPMTLWQMFWRRT